MPKKNKIKKASKIAHYASYKASGKEQKNRDRKLARHMKSHPNDKVAEKAASLKVTHRKTPTGKKQFVRLYGIQEVGEGVFSYVSSETFKPGHPVLAMSKQAYPFEVAKKLKNHAIFSEDFKAVYANYVS